MIWLTKEDFDSKIKPVILEEITEFNDSVLYENEKQAIAEIQSYLRSKYDINAIFSTIGDDRNDLIKMLVIDITIYHTLSKPNPRTVSEIRVNRYNEAKRMLEDASKGILDLGLPRVIKEDGKPQSKLRWGSDKRRNY